MVSTWRFWSGKELSLSRRHPFQILLLIAIVLFVVFNFLPGRSLHVGAGVYVQRHLGAGGVLMVSPASLAAGD